MGTPNLLRKVKIDGKWRMLPVGKTTKKDGTVRHDMSVVLHGGRPVVVLEGTYYLEFREGDARVRRAIGSDPKDVAMALSTQASVLDLRAKGLEVDDAPQLRQRGGLTGKTIRDVVEEYETTPPLGHRHRSYTKYVNALQSFRDWMKPRGKTHAIQVDRDDIRHFMTHLVRVQGLDTSTAIGKAVVAAKYMREAGAVIEMKKGDRPKVTKPQPEVYEPAVLRRLFAVAKPPDYARFQTFLLSGLRESEVAHLTWDDFDPRRSTLRVRKKVGFDPKTYQERTVPIPAHLVETLQTFRPEGVEGDDYLFPTSRRNYMKGVRGGQPDQKLLQRLKRLAKKAGLNCGHCEGTYVRQSVSCRTHPICKEFGLHKFRHTYATTLLREGVDLRSLQLLLGHKDMQSTEKYLRALEPEDLLQKINATNLATRFI